MGKKPPHRPESCTARGSLGLYLPLTAVPCRPSPSAPNAHTQSQCPRKTTGARTRAKPIQIPLIPPTLPPRLGQLNRRGKRPATNTSLNSKPRHHLSHHRRVVVRGLAHALDRAERGVVGRDRIKAARVHEDRARALRDAVQRGDLRRDPGALRREVEVVRPRVRAGRDERGAVLLGGECERWMRMEKGRGCMYQCIRPGLSPWHMSVGLLRENRGSSQRTKAITAFVLRATCSNASRSSESAKITYSLARARAIHERTNAANHISTSTQLNKHPAPSNSLGNAERIHSAPRTHHRIRADLIDEFAHLLL